MKIYVEGLSSQHILPLKFENSKTDKIDYIYSKEGIYMIIKNQIKKGSIQDKDAQIIEIDKYKMHIDLSQIHMNKIVYHIPLHHIRDTIQKTRHVISKTLSLIIEMGSISSEDIYFISPASSIPQITQVISSFLCDKVNI